MSNTAIRNLFQDMWTCENSTHHQLHDYNVSPWVVQCNELGRIYLDGYFSILLVFPLCLQLSTAIIRKAVSFCAPSFKLQLLRVCLNCDSFSMVELCCRFLVIDLPTQWTMNTTSSGCITSVLPCRITSGSAINYSHSGTNTVMTSDSQTFNSIARCIPDTTHLYTKQGDT